jgi:predicted  nucleic acid-binding Zn-ribbon protein
MQGLQKELRGHLVELARQEMSCTDSAPTAPLKTRLQELEADKQQVEENLFRATSDASFKALEGRLDEISGEITSIEDQLATLAVEQPRIQNIDEEVEKALGGLSDL